MPELINVMNKKRSYLSSVVYVVIVWEIASLDVGSTPTRPVVGLCSTIGKS